MRAGAERKDGAGMMEDKTASLKEVRVRRPVFIVAALLALVSCGKADNPPTIAWKTVYPGHDASSGDWMEPAHGHGYVLTGLTTGGDSVFFVSLMLLKVDTAGAVEWERTYSGLQSYSARCARKTRDGGYLLFGSAALPFTLPQPYAMKLGSQGDTSWTKVFIEEHLQCGYSAVQASNGGYVFACGNPGADSGVVVVATDSNGSAVWVRRLMEPCWPSVENLPLIGSATGGYLVGARGLTRLDSAGHVVWS